MRSEGMRRRDYLPADRPRQQQGATRHCCGHAGKASAELILPDEMGRRPQERQRSQILQALSAHRLEAVPKRRHDGSYAPGFEIHGRPGPDQSPTSESAFQCHRRSARQTRRKGVAQHLDCRGRTGKARARRRGQRSSQGKDSQWVGSISFSRVMAWRAPNWAAEENKIDHIY